MMSAEYFERNPRGSSHPQGFEADTSSAYGMPCNVLSSWYRELQQVKHPITYMYPRAVFASETGYSQILMG